MNFFFGVIVFLEGHLVLAFSSDFTLIPKRLLGSFKWTIPIFPSCRCATDVISTLYIISNICASIPGNPRTGTFAPVQFPLSIVRQCPVARLHSLFRSTRSRVESKIDDDAEIRYCSIFSQSRVTKFLFST